MMLQRLLACLLAVFVAAPLAHSQDHIATANAAYRTIQQGKRSDLILLPLVAKMDAAPAPVSTPERAMMVPAGSSAWSAAEAWAMAAPQRAVLEALDRITQEDTSPQGFAWGLPYGSDALGSGPDGIALIRANLYVELGSPPLLAAAKFLYLPALDNVASLVHVEATRLAAEGKVAQAIEVLTDLVFLGRQMADRQMFEECRWGIRTMSVTLDRIRDVAYVDFRFGSRVLTPEQISSILERLRPDGMIAIDRIQFPRAQQIAANQVIAATFEERRGPNPETFAKTMSRLASTQRPLRLFAEAARWNEVAAVHANWFDTTAQVEKIFGDWYSRWPLESVNPRLALTSDYEKTGRRQFAALLSVIPDMSVLLNDRQILRTQIVGTRCALGMVAFYYRSKDFPQRLEAIRPTFVKVIEADPFNPDRAGGKQPPLEYFVPVRDQTFGTREDPKPHEMNVLPRGGGLNFQVKVDRDQFILYSVGPDGRKDWAKDVSGEPTAKAVGDLLIWPPITSLMRQRLMETGQLK
jgi:hypothetical protein